MNLFLKSFLPALILGISFLPRIDANAQIKVAYNYRLTSLKGTQPTVRDIPFILHITADKSKFYSPPTEFNDSLLSTPAGSEIYHRMLHEAIKRYAETKDESMLTNTAYRTQLYVFKHYPTRICQVYDYIYMQGSAYYQEPLEEIDWELTDSTKIILGYECQQAMAQFRGRQWSVWFAGDIPLQEGPWKLHGLPGLILEASEQCGHHIFTATGIEKSTDTVRGIYSPEKYDKTDRISLLRTQHSARLNGNASFAASTGINVQQSSPTASDLYKHDFLETDYR